MMLSSARTLDHSGFFGPSHRRSGMPRWHDRRDLRHHIYLDGPREMAITDINNIFDAEPKSLAEFLGSNDQGCFIPSYQRAYNWHDAEVDRLFEDTITGLNRLPDAPASLRFLGTIITVTDKSLLGVAEPMDQQLPETVMTLIDGQQRLSTLVIVNILLHDAIRQLRGQLTAEELGDGFEQVVTDYLYDLVKTFQFVGRPSDTIHQNYPRIIRARVDQWARHQDNARYESPIARLIWAYIEHTAPRSPIAPFVYAVPDDDGEALGHAALVSVVDHVRTALGHVASGSFADRSIIEPHRSSPIRCSRPSSGWPSSLAPSSHDYAPRSASARQPCCG
ncbi:DUF262 domain-containing protein [Sphingomonas koreensis]|nr:DUF262 domain-containing protein [Sphingomonas koreensis]RSU64163.1 DUF262 domain-containing protein [Sphingomonas koreensis]